MIPSRKEQLRFVVTGSTCGPAKLLPIGREYRQTIEAISEGDADRFASARGVHEEQLEIVESQLVCGKNDVSTRWVKIRRPGHAAKIGELPYVRAVELHGEDVRDDAVAVE